MSSLFNYLINNNGVSKGNMRPPPKGLGTLSVHLDHGSDPSTGALMPPIHLSTTFEQKSPGVPISEFEYSRSGNPTRKALEHAIAKLENGTYGLALSSGLAVITLLGHLLRPGDHIIATDDLYGGTKRYFDKILGPFKIETTYNGMQDVDKMKELFRPETKVVWIETPTNPTLSIVDIRRVCELARSIRADILIIVDNTFLTPYLQRPLDLGADVVIHSATKYLNGHCDVIMGMMVCNDEVLYKKLAFLQNSLGVVPSPFDCYMLMRGMRTLHVRMDRHCENAIKVAEFLSKHSMVEKVFFPGLPSHPAHSIASSQQFGFGGMVSFRLKCDLSTASKFTKSTKIFVLAESLGGVESLIELPAVMTHGQVSLEARKELGITDSFVRLSVGIEDADDLVEDLRNALEVTFSN